MDDLSKQPEELFKFLDSLNYDNKKPPLNNNGDNENINYQDKTENFNQGIIRKGLLPQLKKNEKQKRSIKAQVNETYYFPYTCTFYYNVNFACFISLLCYSELFFF